VTVFRTSIEINATKEAVFAVLCDLEGYQKSHPNIKKIFGRLEQGGWLTAYFGKSNRSLKIPLLITICEKNKKLEWQGSLFKKGMFRKYFLVRHAFYVEELETGLVKFTNEEEFDSMLSKPVKRKEDSFILGYKKVNEALKNYCENPV